MPKFVLCRWLDAWAQSSDSATEKDAIDKHKPSLMETSGWLLCDDEQGVSIFQERCLDKGDESYRTRTFIPKAMIQEITPVKLTRPRKRIKVPNPIPPS